jgi:oligoendopeptidase F
MEVTMTEGVATGAPGVRWDLGDLFARADDPRWASELEGALADAAAFAERYRGTIAVAGGPPAEHLREALVAYEAIHTRSALAQSYARLLYAADSSSAVHRELVARTDQFATELRNRLLFFDLEWLDLPEADSERVMAEPALATYREYLRRERLMQPHKLTEPEEKVANEKDLTGRRAWTKLFQEITSALSFPLPTDGGGTRQVTLAELMARMYDPRREVRQAAHDTLYGELTRHSHVLTFTYDTLVQDHLTMDRLRRFPSPMFERHLSNNVPPEAVDEMMDVVEEHYGLAHRYFSAKADLLGIDKLQIWDQYAPIGDSATTRPYDEARAIVLEALASFEPRFRDLAAEFFDRSWIDAEVRPGKRGGAFCSYPVPSVHPYVLMNYTGNRRDVMTLAHELGHGIHGQLARGQTVVNYHPPLPLAETASVFAEMLVFDHVLEREDDPKARLALTAGMVENIFATVFRQNVLTRFEQRVYAARGEGRLTTEKIADHWWQANAPYYGDALQMSEGYRLGWSYIPHFINTRFYCYAYTFGELLVLALYALYRERGRSFVPDYLRLLELGGSVAPADALASLGVDVRDRNFWRKGFVEVERLIEAVVTNI